MHSQLQKEREIEAATLGDTMDIQNGFPSSSSGTEGANVSGHQVKRSWSQKNRQVAPLHVFPEGNAETTHAEPLQLSIKIQAPPQTSIETQGRHSAQTDSEFYRNPISLIIFIFHLLAALAGIAFLGFKGIQSDLKSNVNFETAHWYPQLVTAAVVGAVFALLWQKAVLLKPQIMVKWGLWFSPTVTFMAAMMLITTSDSPEVILGALLLLFSVCQALYSSWVTPRVKYAQNMLQKALEPAIVFPKLHKPSYWITLLALIWILGWTLGVLGGISQKYAALTVLVFIISLAWMMVVLRNIVSVTVSRVVALFYLRGMYCDVHISLQRAMTTSLGSINLGTMLVPVLEFLRVLARAVNLLEVEDEFMFSCAHCYLRVMEIIFRFGNNWGFVQVAAYHKGFVKASKDTWQLLEQRNLWLLINQDLTSSICFLSGVAGGSLCMIVGGAWTFATHKSLTATISLLSFLMGYFMTRISMAVPQACVCAYYVCYAESPQNRAFDNTIPDRLRQLEAVIARET